MEKAKAAVQDFISRDGKHKTTVDEDIRAPVTEEHIKPHQHDEVTTAVDRSVHVDHHHTTVQPVSAKETLPEQHQHNILPVDHKTVHHGNERDLKDTLDRDASKYQDTSTTHHTTHSSSTAPVVAGERTHHHVHEHVQPVIQKEVVAPQVVHTTVPIHETHHVGAQHHGTSVLPTKTLDEFTATGASLEGRTATKVGEFDGQPKAYDRSLQTEQLEGDRHLTGGGVTSSSDHHRHGGAAAGAGILGAGGVAGAQGLGGSHHREGDGLTGTSTNRGGEGLTGSSTTHRSEGLTGGTGTGQSLHNPSHTHDHHSHGREGAAAAGGIAAAEGLSGSHHREADGLTGTSTTRHNDGLTGTHRSEGLGGSHHREGDGLTGSSTTRGSDGLTGTHRSEGLGGSHHREGDGLPGTHRSEGLTGTHRSEGLTDTTGTGHSHHREGNTSTGAGAELGATADRAFFSGGNNKLTSGTAGDRHPESTALGGSTHDHTRGDGLTGTTGHSSTLGNASEKVNSEGAFGGPAAVTSATGTTGHTGHGDHSGHTGHTGTTDHTGTTSSEHKPSLVDKLNPFKDADGDGKKGFMK